MCNFVTKVNKIAKTVGFFWQGMHAIDALNRRTGGWKNQVFYLQLGSQVFSMVLQKNMFKSR